MLRRNVSGAIIFLLVLCLGVGDLAGQSVVPNFSGTWIYDKKKSKAGHEAKDFRADSELVIQHAGAEVKIEARSKSNQTLTEEKLIYTDGRGEKFTRSYLGGKVETLSKTVWEGIELVTRYSYNIHGITSIPADPKNKSLSMPVYIVERYGLSDEGNTLTISFESKVDLRSSGLFQGASSNSKRTSRHVYRKKL